MHESSNENQNYDQNSGFNRSVKPSPFDILFILFITILLIGGIKLSYVKDQPAPLAPSLLFGSAISILVYYYLGGIKKSDAGLDADIGNIRVKFAGGLAALVGTTLIINPLLEKQMQNISFNYDPKDILALNKKGEPQSVNISANIGGNHESQTVSPSKETIENIKYLCRRNKGICKEDAKSVNFWINENSKLKNIASLCQGNSLDSYPLALLGIKNEVIRVTAVADKIDKKCLSPDQNPMQIYISNYIACRLGVHDGSKGIAIIPALVTTASPENEVIKNSCQ